jgi:hypothetical protein
MRPKSFAALLFLLNRYATLIQFIIIVIGKLSSRPTAACAHILVAFNDPGWTGKVREICSNSECITDDLSWQPYVLT